MANRKATITIPDSFDRLISEGYERLPVEQVTPEMTTAAFQEIINLLAMLLPSHFGPHPSDVLYFKEMEENIRVWGHGRDVTPEAQAIGSGFLAILNLLVESPAFDRLQKNTRLGD